MDGELRLPAVRPEAALAWAEQELGSAQLGDARRVRRLVKLAATLLAQPTASVPKACEDWASTKAAYRFFDLGGVAGRAVPEEILGAHRRATKQRLSGQRLVLAVQDTTSLDLTTHPATTGLGPLSAGRRLGLWVHSTLAVDLEGVPMGLLHSQCWARDAERTGQRHQRRERPIGEKESRKWLEPLAPCAEDLPPGVTLVHVGDAESDVYDLFLAGDRQEQTELLVRAAWDRRVEEPGRHLEAELERQPPGAPRVVVLQRTPKRAAREATLVARYGTVTLRPPKHRAAERLEPVVLDAVLVEELNAPAGVEPIRWLLLTSVPVTSEADAWERVTWYTYRWRIERYHYVLKSGCRIESRQLATAERLECCLALYQVIASWLLCLTYQARVTPTAPATELITVAEWALLWSARHPRRPVPEAPTLRDLVREIAGLGGFLGRRGDGEPGVKTLWLGLQRWHDLRLGYALAGYQLLGGKDVGNG